MRACKLSAKQEKQMRLDKIYQSVFVESSLSFFELKCVLGLYLPKECHTLHTKNRVFTNRGHILGLS